jgi:hypothetical protein
VKETYKEEKEEATLEHKGRLHSPWQPRSRGSDIQ